MRYLEHLVTPLIAAGIMRSTRGRGGGVTLARKPEEIKLSDVIHLLEGSIAPVECVDHPEVCDRYAVCVTREVWSELKGAINGVLESITLQDLVERQMKRGLPKDGMYYI